MDLKKEYEEHSEKRVLLVAVPLPPTPVRGLLFGPQSYASKSYDRWEFQRKEADFKIITARFSNVLGPVVLVSTKIKYLIGIDTDLFTVKRSTYCARVSYHKMPLFGTTYADEVVVDDLHPIESSCHPGSHYIVPKAPGLTAVLQYTQAPDIDNDRRANQLNDFEYLDPVQGEMLFPEVDWSCNIDVEEQISKWPFNVSMSELANGPGEWARPFLTRLRQNKFLRKGVIRNGYSYSGL